MPNPEIKILNDDLKATAERMEKIRVIKPLPATDRTISLNPIFGTWTHCDPDTRGICRIDFKEEKGTLIVNVFGKCHPTACDWGKVKGMPYAANVASNEIVAFSALYDHGFSKNIVTGYLDEGSLVVECFTDFTDTSGRSDYYSKVYLCKTNKVDKEGC